METSDFSTYIADRTRDFTGREWVFQKLDAWLETDAPRLYLITGGPGSGKTALAARLVQMSQGQVSVGGYPNLGPGCVTYYHFCRALDNNTLEPLRFIKALSKTLADRYQPFAYALTQVGDQNITIHSETQVGIAESGVQVAGVVIQELYIGKLSPRIAFDQVVRGPLEKLCTADFKETIVILLDSLDEALTYDDENNIVQLLADATGLPQQVRFLLTSRPDDRVQNAIGESSLDLVDNAPNDANDVLDYAIRRLSTLPESRRNDFAGRIATAASGNFLYARYVLDDLLPQINQVTDLSSLPLPKDLQDHYRKYLQRELRRNLKEWERDYRPILGIIAVAQGTGLTLAKIAGASKRRISEIHDILAACDQFLTGKQPDGPFRIYHQSFREFLLEDPTYVVYPEEAHQALVDFFTSEYAGKWRNCPDEYALRYIVTHLILALQATTLRAARQRLVDLLVTMLTDHDYLETRVRLGSIFELVDAFTQALLYVPDDHAWREVLLRLSELLRSESQFIASHPQTFFQCCWNRGWWYDAPQAASFFEPPPGGWQARPAPWDRPGEKLYNLLESWRVQRTKTGTGSPWLRALRPPPDPIGCAQLAMFLGRGDESFKLVISSDERWLAAGGGEDSGIVNLYDLAGGGQQRASITFEDGEYMSAIAFSPRGNVIVVALGDLSIRLLHAEGLEEIGRLVTSSRQVAEPALVHCMAFSPDGQVLLTGDALGRLIAWDMDTYQEIGAVKAHTGKVSALVFTSDGSEFASAEGDFGREVKVQCWHLDLNAATLPPVQFKPIRSHNFADPIEDLAYSTDGELLACALYSPEAIVLSRTREEVHKFRVSDEERVACLEFTPDSKSLLAGAGDVLSVAYVYCWDLESGKLKWKLPGHNFLVEDLVVFQNGKRLLTAGDNTIRLWDLERAAGGFILNSVEPDIDHAIFSPDGEVIFTACKKLEVVRARQVLDGRLLHQWEDHTGGVSALAISPDSKRLAVGCAAGVVRVWNVNTGDTWMEFAGHQSAVDVLAFSPDGHKLATGSQDGSARLIDLETCQEIAVLSEHKDGWVEEVVFSPDGRLLLTGDYDRMFVWDVVTLERLAQYKTNLQSYYSTCFTDDSRYVVVEGMDEELTAWDVATGKSVPVQDVHRQAYKKLKMRRSSSYELMSKLEGQRSELILRRTDTNVPVTWLPIPYGDILYHPDGQIWGVHRGGHLYLYTLETA